MIKDNQVEIRKAQTKEEDFLSTVDAFMIDYNAALEELVSR